MTESLRPTIPTKCLPADLYAALGDAWRTLIGSDPSRASKLVLVAHWALETGFGHACWNWNLGNVKHVAGDGRDYCQFRCNEVIHGQIVWFDPPDPATSFRAFATLEAGVVDYLALLRGQFGFAWPAVEAGDVADFCHRLKLRQYYTADEGQYTSGVLRCFHQLDLTIPADPDPVADLKPLFVEPDFVQPTPPEDLG